MHGFYVCHHAREVVSRAKDLAASMRTTSIECPEAIVRNASFIREQIEQAREALAAAEAKLPGPKEIENVQRPAA